MSTEELIEEIKTLPKECIPQIRDFVVFLRIKTKNEKPRTSIGIAKQNRFGTMKIKTKDFKFNRTEANER